MSYMPFARQATQVRAADSLTNYTLFGRARTAARFFLTFTLIEGASIQYRV